jgi:hydroxypyruvate reductase
MPSTEASENTLERLALSNLARNIFQNALEDCSIDRAVALKIKATEGEGNARTLRFGQSIIDLSHFKHCRIVAFGKVAPAMLNAILLRLPLPPHCDLAGILISPQPPAHLPDEFEFFAGGHPLPNEESFAGARAVLAMLQAVSKSASSPQDTLCLFLISGGASAMMELPLDPAITLEDTVQFNRALVHCGASITEINCVRKHFSSVKGGRLAMAAEGAECLSILVSDVPAGHSETIASGPTLPDTSTVFECREILRSYDLVERFPASVRRFFASSELPETPKPEHLTAHAWMLLDANDLAEAARQRAEALGFHTLIDNSCDDWDYREASQYLLARFRALRREHGRVCLISVGETAVALPKPAIGADEDLVNCGTGGRNQHFALYTATQLDRSDEPIAVLSAGSDGIDGNSIAAGAVVDGQTLRKPIFGLPPSDSEAQDECLHGDAQLALQQFRSFPFLQASGATITTGPTGNNLRDLRIFLADPPTLVELETGK